MLAASIRDIRDRLSIVSALTPELDTERYLQAFREKSWSLFRDGLYSATEPSCDSGDPDSFDLEEEDAPHDPLPIHWNRGLAAGAALHDLEESTVAQAYGTFPPALRRSDGRRRRPGMSAETNSAALREAPREKRHGVDPSPAGRRQPRRAARGAPCPAGRHQPRRQPAGAVARLPAAVPREGVEPRRAARDRHAGRRQDVLVERAAGRRGAARGRRGGQVAAPEREHRRADRLRPRAGARRVSGSRRPARADGRVRAEDRLADGVGLAAHARRGPAAPGMRLMGGADAVRRGEPGRRRPRAR